MHRSTPRKAMDSFTLSLLVFIMTSVMCAYFTSAVKPTERPEDAKQTPPEQHPAPAAAVEFVNVGNLGNMGRVHPVLRQNVAVVRLMQMDRVM